MAPVPPIGSRLRARLLGALLAAAMLGLGLLCGCAGGDGERFVGTWDLRSGDSPQGGEALTEANVAAMRELGLDAYLNLDESGTLSLVTFDQAKRGDWKATGPDTANATVEGQSATIQLSDDTLRLKQNDTVLVFSKGDPKDPDPARPDAGAPAEEPAQDAGEGLSDLVVRGALWDAPVTVIDNGAVTVIVNGVGADKLGDPGFNLRIANNGDQAVDVWVEEPFQVGGASVAAYLCERVQPGETVTAFMAFDTEDVGSSSPAVLKDVQGRITVDTEQGEVIGRYAFKVARP